MTLEEAGKIYVEQADKLKRVKSSLYKLQQIVFVPLGTDCGPLGPSESVSVNRAFLKDVFEQLQDHKKHLEHVLQKEI